MRAEAGADRQLLRAAIVEAEHGDRVPVVVEGEQHGHHGLLAPVTIVGSSR